MAILKVLQLEQAVSVLKWVSMLTGSLLTVGLERPRLTAAAARLVDGPHHEHVLGAALQAVHRVVVLLDVGHDHPAVQGVAQAWRGGGGGGRWGRDEGWER